MTCSSDGAGVDTGFGGLWFFITRVWPANLVKSTSTSARSAGASTNCFTGTGHVPHAALGTDLPQARTADVEAQDPRVASVQDPEAVHPGLDVQKRPHLAVDQHGVAEVLPDPGGARDVAPRVPERPVRVELAILHDQRDLVGPAGDPDRVGLGPRCRTGRGGYTRPRGRRTRSAGWLPRRGRGTRAGRPASGAAGSFPVAGPRIVSGRRPDRLSSRRCFRPIRPTSISRSRNTSSTRSSACPSRSRRSSAASPSSSRTSRPRRSWRRSGRWAVRALPGDPADAAVGRRGPGTEQDHPVPRPARPRLTRSRGACRPRRRHRLPRDRAPLRDLRRAPARAQGRRPLGVVGSARPAAEPGGGGTSAARPSRWAIAPASARLVAPSLSKMCEAWTLAVFRLMNNASAISWLVQPPAIRPQDLDLPLGEAERVGSRRTGVGRGFPATIGGKLEAGQPRQPVDLVEQRASSKPDDDPARRPQRRPGIRPRPSIAQDGARLPVARIRDRVRPADRLPCLGDGGPAGAVIALLDPPRLHPAQRGEGDDPRRLARNGRIAARHAKDGRDPFDLRGDPHRPAARVLVRRLVASRPGARRGIGFDPEAGGGELREGGIRRPASGHPETLGDRRPSLGRAPLDGGQLGQRREQRRPVIRPAGRVIDRPRRCQGIRGRERARPARSRAGRAGSTG